MKIKVVTFNLRMDHLGDGNNYFFNRAPYILKKINEEKPDVIGFQEATKPIYEWLKAVLTDYTLVGIGRERDFGDEANPIAFRKERFELFSFHQFWLSETPDIPGSRYGEQSICPRICCAAKLMEKHEKKVIGFYNTHLDHIGEKARLLGIGQILALIAKDKKESPYPVVLTGDMNACPEEVSMAAVRDFSEVLLKDVTAKVTKTIHNFKGGSPFDAGEKIDYIYTDTDVLAEECQVWAECHDGIFLSDHYPLAVTLHL